MPPMTTSDLIALCALAVAAVSQAWAMQRTSRAHEAEARATAEADAAKQQSISDQLVGIATDVREVKGTVSEALDDLSRHGRQIAAMGERVSSVETRLTRVEDRCDARASAGGTD